MKNKTKLLVVTVTLAAVLALSLGTVALAAGPANTTGNTASCGLGYGSNWQSEACNEAAGELLGLTTDEIRALRLEGQTLVQIAASRDFTEAQLLEAIMTAKTAEIQNRVTAGTLTQAQADIMLQNMEQKTVTAINRVAVGPVDNGACNGVGNGVGIQTRTRMQNAEGNCLQAGNTTRAGKMFGRTR